MKHIGSLILITLCITLSASAKPLLMTYKAYHAVADTDTVKPVRKSSASIGVSYGTDALFFGRTGPIRYPFVSTDIIVNTKPGFFVYGSGLKVLGYKPLVDEIDVGGGYYYRLSKKYTGTISYTRFIFNKEANIIKSASSNDINWKNTFDWKFLRTSITADYLFGKSDDIFTTLTASKYYESKFSIFTDQDYLSITPAVSMILGTQNFVQRYTDDHNRKLEFDNITDKNIRARNSRFNALNYSLKFPLAYNTPHYTLEASYRYSIPVNVEGILQNRKESFFNLTFYYVFY